MGMRILRRLLGRGNGDIEVVSRKPVGRFRVKRSFRVGQRKVLTGVLEDGMATPGYKLKGGAGVAMIYKIEREGRVVDFVVDGDEAALVLEGELEAEDGDTLDVYAS